MKYKTNNLKIDIRLAKPSDAKNMHQIEQVVYGKNHWSINTFKSEVTNMYSNYYIADLMTEESIKTIGYAGYWKVGNEGHITNIAINKDYQGNNIADILLYTIISSCLKYSINWITLEVRQSNYKAVNLYNKFKFKQLGIRKSYYQDNKEDALILWSENINRSSYIEYIDSLIEKYIVKTPT